MATRYPFRPVLDNRYYQAIGRAIVLWGFLENEIDTHIRILASRNGSPAMSEGFPRSFRRKKKVWSDLAMIHYTGEFLDRINGIIDRCITTRRERDRYAHGTFAAGYDSKGNETLSIISEKVGKQPTEQPVSVERIRANALDSSHLIIDLMIFERDDRNAPDPALRDRLLKVLRSHRKRPS